MAKEITHPRLIHAPGHQNCEGAATMPLTRTKVTSASRVMLPAYVIQTTAYGFVYLLNPCGRLDDAPALTFPRMVMGGSIAPWGALFLALAAVMGTALIGHSRQLYLIALSLYGTTWAMWACLYAASVVVDPKASFTSPFHPAFFTVCAWATSRSLLRGEHS